MSSGLIDTYFDVWILTTERLINIEQKGFFSRETSVLPYGRIEDISALFDGAVQARLNFGDVIIRDESAEIFLFREVADPFALRDTLLRLAKNARV